MQAKQALDLINKGTYLVGTTGDHYKLQLWLERVSSEWADIPLKIARRDLKQLEEKLQP